MNRLRSVYEKRRRVSVACLSATRRLKIRNLKDDDQCVRHDVMELDVEWEHGPKQLSPMA
jgi:hypothetical protein